MLPKAENAEYGVKSPEIKRLTDVTRRYFYGNPLTGLLRDYAA
jgi:hypothetical protein